MTGKGRAVIGARSEQPPRRVDCGASEEVRRRSLIGSYRLCRCVRKHFRCCRSRVSECRSGSAAVRGTGSDCLRRFALIGFYSALIPSLSRDSLDSPLVAGVVVFELPGRRMARRLSGAARHREVRIIRGMLDRREAPQH